MNTPAPLQVLSHAQAHRSAGQAQELGTFLRKRRESIEPTHLGLPGGRRKRTPGLRREDVAALADIGVTWYTKLEQGRDVRASAKVLSAIATALQCTESETQHLFTLAGLAQPVALGRRAGCDKISAASQIILDQLDPLPAVIQNARFDIIGFNQAYCRLVNVDLALMLPEDRNCIFLALTNIQWRASLADLDDILPRMVALFRGAMAEHRDEPLWEQQLQRFMGLSAEFREIWQRYEVRSIENLVKRFRHADAGVFSLQQTNWWSAPKSGDRLLVYVPTDQHSRDCVFGATARDK